MPLPAANRSNVFYARPYTETLHTHDEESGPFQHSTEAKAAPVPRGMNTLMAVGRRGYLRGSPEDNYSQKFPSNSFRGVPRTLKRTMGNAVGVLDSPLPRQEMRTTGTNAVGVVTPVGLGQDGRMVYCSSDGSGGGGGGGGGAGSAQQGEEPWQRRDFRADGDRFGAANMGLHPPPSARQRTSSTTNETNATGMTGNNSWSSSFSDSRPLGERDSWRYATDEEGGAAEEEEDGLDLSFRRFPWSSSALPSTKPTPTTLMPPPSPEVDRWRRDNPQVQQRPSSVSITLTPRLQSLERIVFSEGFTSVSMGPPPTSEEEKGEEERKEAGGGDAASTTRI